MVVNYRERNEDHAKADSTRVVFEAVVCLDAKRALAHRTQLS